MPSGRLKCVGGSNTRPLTWASAAGGPATTRKRTKMGSRTRRGGIVVPRSGRAKRLGLARAAVKLPKNATIVAERGDPPDFRSRPAGGIEPCPIPSSFSRPEERGSPGVPLRAPSSFEEAAAADEASIKPQLGGGSNSAPSNLLREPHPGSRCAEWCADHRLDRPPMRTIVHQRDTQLCRSRAVSGGPVPPPKNLFALFSAPIQ